MNSISIKIQTKEEWLKNGEQIFPEANPENTRTAKKVRCGILEDMTEGRKASICIMIETDDPNKPYTVANLTENIFLGMVSAVKGALLRFEDNKKANDN